VLVDEVVSKKLKMVFSIRDLRFIKSFFQMLQQRVFNQRLCCSKLLKYDKYYDANQCRRVLTIFRVYAIKEFSKRRAVVSYFQLYNIPRLLNFALSQFTENIKRKNRILGAISRGIKLMEDFKISKYYLKWLRITKVHSKMKLYAHTNLMKSCLNRFVVYYRNKSRIKYNADTMLQKYKQCLLFKYFKCIWRRKHLAKLQFAVDLSNKSSRPLLRRAVKRLKFLKAKKLNSELHFSGLTRKFLRLPSIRRELQKCFIFWRSRLLKRLKISRIGDIAKVFYVDAMKKSFLKRFLRVLTHKPLSFAKNGELKMIQPMTLNLLKQLRVAGSFRRKVLKQRVVLNLSSKIHSKKSSNAAVYRHFCNKYFSNRWVHHFCAVVMRQRLLYTALAFEIRKQSNKVFIKLQLNANFRRNAVIKSIVFHERNTYLVNYSKFNKMNSTCVRKHLHALENFNLCRYFLKRIWVKRCIQIKSMLLSNYRAIEHYLFRQIFVLLNIWKSTTNSRSFHQYKITSGISHHNQRLQKVYLFALSKFYNRQQLVKLVLKRSSIFALRRYLKVWKRRLKRLKIVGNSSSSFFKLVLSKLSIRRIKSSTIVLAFNHYLSRLLKFCLLSWNDRASIHKTNNNLFIYHHHNFLLRKAIKQLKSLCYYSKNQRSKISATALQLSKLYYRRCFKYFRRAPSLKYASKFLSNKIIGKCFNQWKCKFALRQNATEALKIIFHFASKISQNSAFDNWKVFTRTENKILEKLRGIALKELGNTINGWKLRSCYLQNTRSLLINACDYHSSTIRNRVIEKFRMICNLQISNRNAVNMAHWYYNDAVNFKVLNRFKVLRRRYLFRKKLFATFSLNKGIENNSLCIGNSMSVRSFHKWQHFVNIRGACRTTLIVFLRQKFSKLIDSSCQRQDFRLLYLLKKLSNAFRKIKLFSRFQMRKKNVLYQYETSKWDKVLNAVNKWLQFVRRRKVLKRNIHLYRKLEKNISMKRAIRKWDLFSVCRTFVSFEGERLFQYSNMTQCLRRAFKKFKDIRRLQ